MSDGPQAAGHGTSEKASTGIHGFDDILAGGLPRNRLYLVEGMPGTGKTTLALQFLLEGRRLGERGMYVTLSETADELRASAATPRLVARWHLRGRADALRPTSAPSRSRPCSTRPSSSLARPLGASWSRLEQEHPARLVLDSLSELRLLAQTPLRYRRQILALKHRFTSHRCTVLLLDDQTAEPRDLQLHSIAHGVVALEQSSNIYGAERRSLRVVKLRGVQFRGGHHDYTIEDGRPRGLSAPRRSRAP